MKTQFLLTFALLSMFVLSLATVAALPLGSYSIRGDNGAASIGDASIGNVADFSAYSTNYPNGGSQGQGTLEMQGRVTDGKLASVRINFKQTSKIVAEGITTVTADYRGFAWKFGATPYAINGVLTCTYNSAAKTVVVSGPNFGASFTKVVSL